MSKRILVILEYTHIKKVQKIMLIRIIFYTKKYITKN